MAEQDSLKSAQQSGQISEVITLVKEYARQETVGPLRGAGRWLGFGAAGALLLATASVFLVVGVLRLMQNEFASTFSGRWMSLLPYAAALTITAAIIALAVSRIGKTSLHKD